VTETQEETWIEAARRGDREAFQYLMELHHRSLYRYVLTTLSFDREMAADITQDTILSAFSSIRGFRDESTFRTWLVGIASNHIRSVFRKRRMHDSSVRAVTEPDESQGPDIFAALEIDELIKTVVKRLPMGQRQALYLREFLGCSFQEIATTLGIGVSAAKNRVHEGRKNMLKEARTLAPDWFDDGAFSRYASTRR
jgi:RNA polymerase sigma-70 factor (ECF subfamily)